MKYTNETTNFLQGFFDILTYFLELNLNPLSPSSLSWSQDLIVTINQLKIVTN